MVCVLRSDDQFMRVSSVLQACWWCDRLLIVGSPVGHHYCIGIDLGATDVINDRATYQQNEEQSAGNDHR